MHICNPKGLLRYFHQGNILSSVNKFPVTQKIVHMDHISTDFRLFIH